MHINLSDPPKACTRQKTAMMYSIYFLIPFLFHSTSLALPATTPNTPSLSLPNPPPNLRKNIGTTTLTGTLSVGDDVPWGPSFFAVDIEHQTATPIDRRIFFLTTTQLLASQAPLDFNAQLQDAIYFSLPQFPNLQITITTHMMPTQRPLLRKYVFWAMTRIMQDYISRENEWVTRVFVMKMRGAVVGNVGVRNPTTLVSSLGDEEEQKVTRLLLLMDDKNITTPMIAATPEIETAISAGSVRFEYQHLDEQMTQPAIFMGVIAAIFKVAGELSHDFETFVSAYIQYKFVLLWESESRPSMFSWGMLLQAIVGAAKFAVAKNVWRSLRGAVFVDGRQVAWGGWFDAPSMGSRARLTSE
ncbi:MAG: hypothetical protein Q9169_002820 [Polycauliona sp. 2 TL-2023]